jgi:hypothetical protein
MTVHPVLQLAADDEIDLYLRMPVRTRHDARLLVRHLKVVWPTLDSAF